MRLIGIDVLQFWLGVNERRGFGPPLRGREESMPPSWLTGKTNELDITKQSESRPANGGRLAKNLWSQLTLTRRVWGGAGKGIVLGQALQNSSTTVLTAVDAHPNRWGTFLETSGLPVISPEKVLQELPPSTTILVCNPNHLEEISNFVHGRFNLLLPEAFI